MPQHKTKLDANERLVEDSAEAQLAEQKQLVAGEEAPQPVSGLEQAPAPNLSQIQEIKTPAQNVSQIQDIKTPGEFLKAYSLPAAKFTLISLAFASLAYFIYPAITVASLNNSYMRTALLALFIWNLIGAILFAQARERWAKSMIVFFFAVPLATTGLWLQLLLIVVLTLSHFLPPSLM